ncbi:MAG: hypothetical protein JWN04_4482 [Myxococcaceae bacterium]|nr:hypothetical protein [Myxococcaceae bacterium]
MVSLRRSLAGLTLSLCGLLAVPARAQPQAPAPGQASPDAPAPVVQRPTVEPAPAVAGPSTPVSPPFLSPSPQREPPALLQLFVRPPVTVKGTPPPFPEQSPPAVEENTTNKPEPEAAPKASAATLSIGAGLIVWYYQPFLKGVKNRAEDFYARLSIDGKKGIWGLHVEPRFRDTKQRSFEDGPVFLQESYLSAAPGDFVIKVGKSYSHLGLFWDNSFYGNVQVYDGLKLAPDYGINIAANHDFNRAFKLGYTAQFFIIDGRTNVSLVNRDIVSVPGARQRNNLILRVDPELKLGGTNSLRVGVSGQMFQADFASANPTVLRGALDAKFSYDGLGLWGEYIYQHGRHVTDYPVAATAANGASPAIAGHASGKNHYALAGGEYTYGYVTARFNFSYVNYSQVSVHETFFVPGVGIKPIAELLLLAEYVHWRRYDHGEASFVDRSLNVTAQGFF